MNMALIKCADCGEFLSNKARCCPNCGCSVAKSNEHWEPIARLNSSREKRISVIILLNQLNAISNLKLEIVAPNLADQHDVDKIKQDLPNNETKTNFFERVFKKKGKTRSIQGNSTQTSHEIEAITDNLTENNYEELSELDFVGGISKKEIDKIKETYKPDRLLSCEIINSPYKLTDNSVIELLKKGLIPDYCNNSHFPIFMYSTSRNVFDILLYFGVDRMFFSFFENTDKHFRCIDLNKVPIFVWDEFRHFFLNLAPSFYNEIGLEHLKWLKHNGFDFNKIDIYDFSQFDKTSTDKIEFIFNETNYDFNKEIIVNKDLSHPHNLKKGKVKAWFMNFANIYKRATISQIKDDNNDVSLKFLNMIEHRIDLKATTSDGENVYFILHDLPVTMQLRLVTSLLKKGVSPFVRNNEGVSFSDLLLKKGKKYEKTIAIFDSLEPEAIEEKVYIKNLVAYRPRSIPLVENIRLRETDKITNCDDIFSETSIYNLNNYFFGKPKEDANVETTEVEEKDLIKVLSIDFSKYNLENNRYYIFRDPLHFKNFYYNCDLYDSDYIQLPSKEVCQELKKLLNKYLLIGDINPIYIIIDQVLQSRKNFDICTFYNPCIEVFKLIIDGKSIAKEYLIDVNIFILKLSDVVKDLDCYVTRTSKVLNMSIMLAYDLLIQEDAFMFKLIENIGKVGGNEELDLLGKNIMNNNQIEEEQYYRILVLARLVGEELYSRIKSFNFYINGHG